MTSPTQSPVEAADLVDPASAESVEKPEIPAFKFPFKPGELAGGQECRPALVQEWRQKRPYEVAGHGPAGYSPLNG